MFLRGCAALLALASTSSAQGGTMNSGMPPERFRGNTMAVVVFTDKAGIDAACGVAPEGYHIIACTTRTKDGVPVMIMPNACPLGDVEFYARITCHEAGHVQGWGPDHED